MYNQTGIPGDGVFLFDSRIARDPALSDKARGRLLQLWCLADDRREVWTSLREMTDQTLGGRSGVASAVADLIEAGYLERITRRDDDGKVIAGGYRIVPSGGTR